MAGETVTIWMPPQAANQSGTLVTTAANIANSCWGYWNNQYMTATGAIQTYTVPPSDGTGTTVWSAPAEYNSNVWRVWNQDYQYAYQANQPYVQSIMVPSFANAEPPKPCAASCSCYSCNQKRAQATAEELLFTMLTAAQRAQYEEKGYFETEVNDKIYRINKRSYSGNIEVVNTKGEIIESLCCHLKDGSIPLQDHLLAQKIMLETSEAEFRKTANITRRR